MSCKQQQLKRFTSIKLSNLSNYRETCGNEYTFNEMRTPKKKKKFRGNVSFLENQILNILKWIAKRNKYRAAETIARVPVIVPAGLFLKTKKELQKNLWWILGQFFEIGFDDCKFSAEKCNDISEWKFGMTARSYLIEAKQWELMKKPFVAIGPFPVDF